VAMVDGYVALANMFMGTACSILLRWGTFRLDLFINLKNHHSLVTFQNMLLWLFLALVLADDLPPLRKSDLAQMMAVAEKQRYTTEIVRDIYTSVVEEASNGKGQYVTDFTGCDASNPKISQEMCNSIVEDVFHIMHTKFPDSSVSYDVNNKEFKIVWT
jgi:hypothetical protein